MDEELLRKGIAALRNKDKKMARSFLSQVVKKDPSIEQGWLWLSGAVSTREECRFCLSQVLSINPHNAHAQKGLKALGPGAMRSPLEPSKDISPAKTRPTTKPDSKVRIEKPQKRQNNAKRLVIGVLLLGCFVICVGGIWLIYRGFIYPLNVGETEQLPPQGSRDGEIQLIPPGLSDPEQDIFNPEDWPMYGHDLRNTNYSEYQVSLPLTERWQFEGTGRPITKVLFGEKLFVGTLSGYVYAVDANSGTLIWQHRLEEGVTQELVATESFVFAAAEDRVYALDSATGNRIWLSNFGDNVASPSFSYDTLYVGVYNGYIYALDADSGERLWGFRTGRRIDTTPAISQHTVYVTSWNQNIYALDALSGEVIWQFATGSSICSSPAIADGKVVFGGQDGNVYALDMETGSLMWTFPAGLQFRSSPAIAHGLVFIGLYDGRNLYAIDLETGRLVWDYVAEEGFHEHPVVFGDTVFALSYDGNYYSFNAPTGERLQNLENFWNAPIIGNSGTVYAIQGNIVYAFSSNGQ